MVLFWEGSSCDASGLVLICEFVFSGEGICGANDCFEWNVGECNFNMLINFFNAFCLFLITFFIELRILDIVAATKFSSYVYIF